MGGLIVSKISARRVFVSAGVFKWVPQIFVVYSGETAGNWFDMLGAREFDCPDTACRWGVAQRDFDLKTIDGIENRPDFKTAKIVG